MSYYSKFVSMIEKVDDISAGAMGDAPPTDAHLADVSAERPIATESSSTSTAVSAGPHNDDNKDTGSAASAAAQPIANSAATAVSPSHTPLPSKPARRVMQDFYNIDLTKLTPRQRKALDDGDEDEFAEATEEATLEAETIANNKSAHEAVERDTHAAQVAKVVEPDVRHSAAASAGPPKSTSVAPLHIASGSKPVRIPTIEDITKLLGSSADSPSKVLAGYLGEALAQLESHRRTQHEHDAEILLLNEQLLSRDALLERLRLQWPALMEKAQIGTTTSSDELEEAQSELDAHRDLVATTEPMQRLQTMLATNAKIIESLERSNAALRAQIKHEEVSRDGELQALQKQIEGSAFDSLKLTEVVEESNRRKTELGRLSRKIASLQQLLDERSGACEGFKSQVEALEALLKQRRNTVAGDGTHAVTIGDEGMNIGGTGETGTGPQSRHLHQSKVYQSLDKVKFGRNLQQGISTIDFASMFLGRFLRRHAFLRVFILVYVVVIHLYLFGAVYSGLHSLPLDGHDLHDHISHHIDHHH